MKKKLNIIFGNEQQAYDGLIVSPFDDDVCILTLYLDSNKDFFKIDNEYIVNVLKSIEPEDDFYEEFEDPSFDIMERIISGEINYLDEYDTLSIDGDYEQINELLSKHPELFDKKIVVSRPFSLSKASLQEIKNHIDHYEKLYYTVCGDINNFSFDEIEQATNKFQCIVDEVKKYNYSPLEIALHLYDLVRDRYYIEGNTNEEDLLSKGLASILLDDKVVCAGFVNLYNALLKKFGIEVNVYRMDKNGSEVGHVKTLAYIKDDKYNIDGYLFFDPTWDCRKSESNNFLNIYRYFGQNYLEMTNAAPEYTGKLNSKKSLLDEYYEWEYEEDSKIKEQKKFKLLERMAYLSLIIDGVAIPKFLVSQEIDYDKLYEYYEKMECSIDNMDFMRAFINVRRNEYYVNPDKYPFDMSAFYTGLVYSDFAPYYTAEESLLSSIFGSNPGRKENNKNTMIRVARETNLAQDIERVKTARVLRKVLEKKKK